MSRSTKVKVFMLLIRLVTIVTMITFVQVASAEEIPLASSPPAVIYYTTNGADPTSDPSSDISLKKAAENERMNKELKNKLLKKYIIVRDLLTIKLDHTQYGPKGRLILSGKILPPNKSKFTNSLDITPSKGSNALSIALAFLEEEADMLGITNMSEIKMAKNYLSFEKTHTHIIFNRYINEIPLYNELAEWYVHIIIGPSDQITSVSAELTPTPPELYEAVKKETLPKAQAREIAEEVLRGGGFDVNTDPSIRKYLKAEKIAISPPLCPLESAQ